jgi:hypothetical protein
MAALLHASPALQGLWLRHLAVAVAGVFDTARQAFVGHVCKSCLPKGAWEVGALAVLPSLRPEKARTVTISRLQDARVGAGPAMVSFLAVVVRTDYRYGSTR